MLDSFVSIFPPESDALPSVLPDFRESLPWSQRYPCMVVVAGLMLTVAAGVTGLAVSLGGAA